MYRIITMVPLVMMLAPIPASAQKLPSPGPLSGLVLILDPGHGGKDPGSHGVFQGQNVYEAPYTLDQAYRIKYFAEKAGAKVYLTVASKEVGGHRNWPAAKIFEIERDVFFSLEGSRVEAGKSGLNKRVQFANKIASQHRGQKIVFLAIHFDIAGEDSKGAFIITPKEYTPEIAKDAVESLNGLASKRPLRPAGKNGQKNIQILRGANNIREKVLIELGNFKNDHDNYVIRNFETRNRFAVRLVEALARYNKNKQ